MKIKINEELFELEVKRKNIKNMYLRFKRRNHLTITCNMFISDERIKSFIDEKKLWILKANNQLSEKESFGYQSIDESLYFLDKFYWVEYHKSSKNNIFISKDKFIFQLRNLKKEKVLKLFEEFSRNYYNEIINEYRIKYDSILKSYGFYTFPNISFKKLKGRWGFCVPKQNRIVISTSLIHYPIKCFEYVLLHEYIHLLIPNHSKAFYDTISMYMPDYKVYVEILKK